MPPDVGLRVRLGQAEKQEKDHKWFEAAKSYEAVLNSGQVAAPVHAEIMEKLGLCYSMASMQARNPARFRELRQLSVESYRNSADLFESGGKESKGKGAHCRAVAEYTRSWLTNDPMEKRAILDECLKLGRKGLEAYESVGDKLNSSRMYNDLMLILLDRWQVSLNSEEMKNVLQEGTDYGEKAITILSEQDNETELLRAYYLASLLEWPLANVSEKEDEMKEHVNKSLSYSEKAVELSKKVNNPYHTSMSNWAATVCTLLFTEKVEISLKYAEEMMEQAAISKSNFLQGVASYILAFVTNWMTVREGDPEKKKEGHENIIKYAEDAIRYLQLVCSDYFIAQTYWLYSESCSSLARDVEVSSEAKRSMLERAVGTGREGLGYAARSGSPDATGSALHALSKALQFYSTLETEKEKKTKLLEEALSHRMQYNAISERAFSSNIWVRGVGKSYEGLIKAEIARVETNKEKRKDLLEGAVSDMESGVAFCRRSTNLQPLPTRIAATGSFEEWFGQMLNELYALTEDKKTLIRANEANRCAAEEFKKVDLPSRVAESYWKIARNQDCMGEYQKAAENFESAVNSYKAAAQKMPHFSSFYLDYASYMEAWSEIEKAKLSHEQEEYAAAMKHYERVACILGSSKLWGYMSTNFLAWSLLEQAEDLSRKGSSNESKDSFKKASALFEEAKEAFERELDKIQNADEKDKASELGNASTRRMDYCLLRVYVEEARLADQMGNHAESAQKYELAASGFERVLDLTPSESDRREIKPIAHMCRAWQKMKMADARASPELYHEASELFLKAREYSMVDRMTLLASGNGSFCRALEYGSRFEETREKDDFSKVKQHLGSAANYYMKAGFDSASVWANATEILFDAYNYMVNAEIEGDPEKKMRTYLLAEKCLERSARLYETAGYIGKKDEVLKTLKNVKEKREFAVSLGELLTAPGEASSTHVIPAPVLNVEEPVGLTKFEREFIQANLVVRQNEIVVGENWDLEIQLANLGKNAAFLTKVEDIIPEGFDLVEKPEKCVANDGCLDLKGRKLASLGTEEIKLTLKPKKKGKFAFAPRLMFMNETGDQKSFELGRVSVSVSELESVVD